MASTLEAVANRLAFRMCILSQSPGAAANALSDNTGKWRHLSVKHLGAYHLGLSTFTLVCSSHLLSRALTGPGC